MALSDREERLLLSVFEAEAENRRLIEQHWENMPEEGYVDGLEALKSERDFARGARHGVEVARDIFQRTING